MREISLAEMEMVVGGGVTDDPVEQMSNDSSGMQTVTVSTTKADVAAAKADYASAQTAASLMTGFAATAATGVVTGACVLGVAAVAGPEVAITPTVTKTCAAVAAPVGAYVGVKTNQILQRGINSSY
jgi:hypothetical protein